MAEDPTRRQQAPPDRAGGEVYEEYGASEAGPSREELADRARSNRNWAYGAAFLGLLAAGLAAVAIILATGDDEGGGRQGASQSAVANLREDVESLQNQLEEISGQVEGADDVSQQVEDLAATVNELENNQESVSEQISQLEERIDEVAQAAEAVGGTGDGGGVEIPTP